MSRLLKALKAGVDTIANAVKVTLGPKGRNIALAKSFGSVISPWIVTLEALEFCRVEGPEQIPAVLPYLQQSGANNYDIALEVLLKTKHSHPEVISRSNTKYLY